MKKKNRKLLVRQKDSEYQKHVIKSTLGEAGSRPGYFERITKEHSYRGKLVRNYLKRLEKLKEKKK